jgi:hypothetical protein
VPWCDADGECKMRDRWMEDSEAHVIAGWGSYLTYHPACCPRENIVGECHEEHPPPEEYRQQFDELFRWLLGCAARISH